MNTINIKLYNILKNDFRLSDEKAKAFAAAINEMAENNASATEFKSAIREDLLKLEASVKTDIKDLELKIEQTKSDLLKWFVGLFITIVLMIVGLYIRK